MTGAQLFTSPLHFRKSTLRWNVRPPEFWGSIIAFRGKGGETIVYTFIHTRSAESYLFNINVFIPNNLIKYFFSLYKLEKHTANSLHWEYFRNIWKLFYLFSKVIQSLITAGKLGKQATPQRHKASLAEKAMIIPQYRNTRTTSYREHVGNRWSLLFNACAMYSTDVSLWKRLAFNVSNSYQVHR